MQRTRRSGWMLLRTKKMFAFFIPGPEPTIHVTVIRPAVTKYVSTKFKPSAEKNKTIRAFLIKPETGRTHQIRVALKSVGNNDYLF